MSEAGLVNHLATDFLDTEQGGLVRGAGKWADEPENSVGHALGRSVSSGTIAGLEFSCVWGTFLVWGLESLSHWSQPHSRGSGLPA